MAALCLGAFAFMEWTAITQFLSGHWFLADVGEVNYILRNSLQGKFMYSPNMEGSNFGYHFSPTLLLLSPLTLLSRYPIPLVTSYVAALAICPIPIFKIARQNGLPDSLGFAAAFLFLANHFVGSIQLANHYEVFFILLMLCTMSLSQGGGVWFWICAMAALGVKEDAAIWMLAYAGFMALDSRDAAIRRRAYILGSASAVVLLIAAISIWLVGRHQSGNAAFYMQRLAGFGFSAAGAKTLLLIFASAAFLSLAGGRAALLVLVPAPMLLGGYEFTRNLLYYYSYPFMPFLIFSAIRGMAAIQRWMVKAVFSENVILQGLFALCMIAGIIQLPLPTRTDNYTRTPFPVTPRDWFRLEAARDKIPRDSPVAIQFGLWGITPYRPGARKLSAKNIAPDASVFLDLQSPRDMDREEYITLVRGLIDETQDGRRPMILAQHDVFIIGPQKAIAGK